MVIDSENEKLKVSLVDAFRSDLIRFYYGSDLLGTEIGAAAKNVMGIAAGVLDVVCVPLKGPLMSRGAREVARLIKAMGGDERSAYGLAHLGDYETTLFSPYSHNRKYGEMLAKGQRFEKLAEGVTTSAAMCFWGTSTMWSCPSPRRCIRSATASPATTARAAARRSPACLRAVLSPNSTIERAFAGRAGNRPNL